MMSKNTGGPAFPRPECGQPGMTLRQWYAGMALQGMIARGDKYFDGVASNALAFADALIAAEQGET